MFILQAKEELKSLMDQNNNSGVKGLADVDTRLNRLNKRVAEMEEAISRLEKVSVNITTTTKLYFITRK